jgi:hypothetical protein
VVEEMVEEVEDVVVDEEKAVEEEEEEPVATKAMPPKTASNLAFPKLARGVKPTRMAIARIIKPEMERRIVAVTRARPRKATRTTMSSPRTLPLHRSLTRK